MKRFQALLFVAGLSAAVGGCGPTDAPRTAFNDPFCGPVMARVDSFMATFEGREWPEDRHGGMAVVASVAELRGFGPLATGDVGSSQHMQFVTHMTLLEFDENLEMRPYLAESWEVSDDTTALTFHLRDDVFWQDGTPTTAHDVAFTYRVFSDPAASYGNQGFFQYYLPGDQAVGVVDDHTVIFRFRRHIDFMDLWRGIPILPHHLLGEVPVGEINGHPLTTNCPVGNGPFRLASQSTGDSWTFEANPAFPEALGGRPYLDRYVYRVIEEHATLMAELRAGGVDVYVQMIPNHAALIADDPSFHLWNFQYPSIFFIAWNSRVPQLSDGRVRQALTKGIDRQALIDGYQAGDAVLLNTGIPPTHWAFDPTLVDEMSYDPDGARALLAEAGWTDRDGDGIRENADGMPLELELVYNQNQERQEVGELIRIHLSEIGVELRPREIEYGAYLGTLTSRERDFDGAFVTFETGFRIDERDLFHTEAIAGPYAFSGTSDERLDRFLDTLQLIPDREAAYPIWRAYQERIIQVQPYTFLYSANRRDGVNTRIRDAVMDKRGDWASIRHWWIAPEDRR
jgi:peptide/nickel transport system substrate-binding protein